MIPDEEWWLGLTLGISCWRMGFVGRYWLSSHGILSGLLLPVLALCTMVGDILNPATPKYPTSLIT